MQTKIILHTTHHHGDATPPWLISVLCDLRRCLGMGRFDLVKDISLQDFSVIVRSLATKVWSPRMSEWIRVWGVLRSAGQYQRSGSAGRVYWNMTNSLYGPMLSCWLAWRIADTVSTLCRVRGPGLRAGTGYWEWADVRDWLVWGRVKTRDNQLLQRILVQGLSITVAAESSVLSGSH